MLEISDADLDRGIQDRLDEFEERARERMLPFTCYTKPDYKINWHHRALARKLDAFIRGEIRFLMVFEPPRHGKSEQVSRRLPALLHGIYPDSDIMAGSYSGSLANDMTADVQRIMDTPEYRKLFPGSLIPAAGTRDPRAVRNSEEHHLIGKRGKYRGQGVGGSFTGKGARFIIIDDPIKGRAEADSESFRETLWNWYCNDLRTRLEGDTGQILITLTRWHEDDLAGRILEMMKKHPEYDQFEVFSLPAIREDMGENPNDPRALGEALWPAKMPLKELAAIRVGDERAFQSLYQQAPTTPGGNLFKAEMFDYVDAPAEYDFSFIMGDTAYKDKQSNDPSAFVYFGVKDGELYWDDMYWERVKASEMEAPVEAFTREKMRYSFRGLFVEPKGHGIYLNQSFPKKGIPVPSEEELNEFYKDRRLDKTQRANNAVPYLRTRKIHINRNMNRKEAALAEVLGFPKAKHDDITDCVIDGIKYVFSREVNSFDVL